MIEKQNAVELKTAAGDAAEIDDVIDSCTEKLMKRVPPPVKGRARADAAVSK